MTAHPGTGQLSRFWFWLLMASGAIPIVAQLSGLNPGPLLMQSAFAGAFAWRRYHPAIHPVQGAMFAAAMLGLTLLLEVSAWYGSYAARAVAPALLHPQLIPDLLLASGFYLGWALAWLLVLRFWRFSIWQIYGAQGVYGILAEQDGAIFLSFNPIAWLYVLVAYGATLGSAFLLFPAKHHAGRDNLWKYPAVIFCCYLFSQFGFLAGAFIWDALGFIPPRRPIWEAPFF